MQSHRLVLLVLLEKNNKQSRLTESGRTCIAPQEADETEENNRAAETLEAQESRLVRGRT